MRPIVLDGFLATISTTVAANAMQHRNKVFRVLRERSAGMIHEKAPGPLLWTLVGGFFAPFESIVEEFEDVSYEPLLLFLETLVIPRH